jgi:hypothetical protein
MKPVQLPGPGTFTNYPILTSSVVEFLMQAMKLFDSNAQMHSEIAISSTTGVLNKYIGDIQTSSIREKALQFWQHFSRLAFEMLAPPVPHVLE